jgi:hypothetical protein
MVRQLSISAFILAIAASALAQQQDPADMQRQMAAADARVSASSNADASYRTPLKSFQTFFAAFQAVSPSVMFQSLTSHGQQDFFGTTQQPAQAEFDALAADINARSTANFVLQSFRYSDNATSPKIVITYSCTATVDGQSVPFKEEVRILLSDTTEGWKIDSWDEADLKP